MIAWQRLVFPDGKALDLGSMPGADMAGYSGFRDQVNNHYFRIFGNALLLSGITATIAYSQDRNQNNNNSNQAPNMSSEMSAALGQVFGPSYCAGCTKKPEYLTYARNSTGLSLQYNGY